MRSFFVCLSTMYVHACWLRSSY